MKLWKKYINSKRLWTIFVIVLIVVVFVPIGINEMYKANKGYETVWTGADVLSYYGTLVSTLSTIIALVCTIQFTRQQIKFERFVQAETEKWRKIESLCISAISLAEPLTLSVIFTSSLSKKSTEGCPELMGLTYRLRSAIDSIHGTIEEKDEPAIHELLQVLENISKEITALSDKYYSLLINYNVLREKTAEQNAPMWVVLLEQQKNTVNSVNSLHENEYLKLLKLKKQCFASIYRKIEEDSSHILNLKDNEGIRWN